MKRRISILLILTALILSMLSVTPATGTAQGILGDVDNDGEVTIIDATAIQRYLADLKPLSDDAIARGKVCGNAELSILDATSIQRKLADLIDVFPAEVSEPTEEPTAAAPTEAPTAPPAAQYELSEYELQVVALTNAERAKYGLQALEIDTALSAVARIKAQDMHDAGYFAHTSPNYGTPFEMMDAFGIEYWSAGENIAMGYRTPQDVVDAWMNSPGHRFNILNESFTRIGVGYVADGSYWTQMFNG